MAQGYAAPLLHSATGFRRGPHDAQLLTAVRPRTFWREPHTTVMLVVMGTIALSCTTVWPGFLRKAWFNMDLIWASRSSRLVSSRC